MSTADDPATTTAPIDAPPSIVASPSTLPLSSSEHSSQFKITEPPAFRIARALVILALLCVFFLIFKINVTRPAENSKVRASDRIWLGMLPLPEFDLVPTSNHTLITSLNCSYDKAVNATAPNITQSMLDDGRLKRIEAWNAFHAIDYNAVVNVRRLVGAQQFGPSLDELLPKERWGSYMVKPERVFSASAGPITCRIGNLVEIGAENATIATPTILQPSNTTLLAGVIPAGYKDEALLLIQGQHTVLTFELIENCPGGIRNALDWPFVPKPDCTSEYPLAMVRSFPVNMELLPPSLQNAPIAEYTYVTLRIKNVDGQAEYPILKEAFDHGILAALASIFSSISILLLVYKLVMGDRKMNPFGWMQRYVLRRKTRQFVKQVNAGKDKDEWVENVLFKFYLDSNGLHYKKHSFLKRLRKKLKHLRKKKEEDASSMV